MYECGGVGWMGEWNGATHWRVVQIRDHRLSLTAWYQMFSFSVQFQKFLM